MLQLQYFSVYLLLEASPDVHTLVTQKKCCLLESKWKIKYDLLHL